MGDIQQHPYHRRVVGALRAAINDHGPITLDRVGSAAKRVTSAIVRPSALTTEGKVRYAEVDFTDAYHYVHWRELPAGTAMVLPDDLFRATLIDALEAEAGQDDYGMLLPSRAADAVIRLLEAGDG